MCSTLSTGQVAPSSFLKCWARNDEGLDLNWQNMTRHAVQKCVKSPEYHFAPHHFITLDPKLQTWHLLYSQISALAGCRIHRLPVLKSINRKNLTSKFLYIDMQQFSSNMWEKPLPAKPPKFRRRNDNHNGEQSVVVLFPKQGVSSLALANSSVYKTICSQIPPASHTHNTFTGIIFTINRLA